VVGDAASCAAQLAALRERYRADEIVVCDLMGELENRRRGHELLAAAWHELDR
jgi:alkanesulfonate monooxygenase SsuD/methylene tetrahydromethanopterin reductase-like flavin-dependent oxidoreductase (luciferase family)